MGMFLQKQNHVIGYADQIHIISQNGKTLISSLAWKKLENTIYWVFSHIENSQSLLEANVATTVHVADYQIWHRRLGHMSDQALLKLPLCTKNLPNTIYK